VTVRSNRDGNNELPAWNSGSSPPPLGKESDHRLKKFLASPGKPRFNIGGLGYDDQNENNLTK